MYICTFCLYGSVNPAYASDRGFARHIEKKKILAFYVFIHFLDYCPAFLSMKPAVFSMLKNIYGLADSLFKFHPIDGFTDPYSPHKPTSFRPLMGSYLDSRPPNGRPRNNYSKWRMQVKNLTTQQRYVAVIFHSLTFKIHLT